jgi:kynureninase
MPRTVLRAVQASLDAYRSPHHIGDGTVFDVPNRLRASLATLIGAQSAEIALWFANIRSSPVGNASPIERNVSDPKTLTT